METLKVKPAAGRQVRDPFTKRPLEVEGGTVPASTYWLRRLHTGDVVLVDETKTKPAAKTATERKE